MSEYEKIVNGKQGYILWGIVFVLVAFIGSIGNIITIIVLRRDPIMSTLTILLIALAISDMLAPQANALLAFSHYHLSSNYKSSEHFLVLNDFLRHIIQPLSTMFTMSSSWIVAATTLFRLIAVMFPFKARTLINKKCAIVSIVIIFGFSLASILPIYSSLVIKTKCTNNIKYKGFSVIMKSDLMRNIYTPMMQIMCFYLPWLIALTLWLCLLRSLRKSERNFNISFVNREASTIININNSTSAFLNNTNTNTNNNTASCASPSVLEKTNSLSLNTPTTRLSEKSLRKKAKKMLSDIDKTESITVFQESLKHSKSIVSQTSNASNQRSNSTVKNLDSRMNNAQTRLKSYNKVTLMVVVLCFTNLICQLFTFVFIFEAIFNKYLLKKAQEDFDKRLNDYNMRKAFVSTSVRNLTTTTIAASASNASDDDDYPQFEFLDVKYRFPKFLSSTCSNVTA